MHIFHPRIHCEIQVSNPKRTSGNEQAPVAVLHITLGQQIHLFFTQSSLSSSLLSLLGLGQPVRWRYTAGKAQNHPVHAVMEQGAFPCLTCCLGLQSPHLLCCESLALDRTPFLAAICDDI